ncbi:MAG: GGDEF domain-containing protein [Pseudomonadota bacterium]
MTTYPPNQPKLDLSSLRSEFASPAVETSFLQHHLADLHSQLRLSVLVGSLFFIAFALTDVAVLGYGDQAFELFVGRLSVGVIAIAGTLLSRWRPGSIAMTRAVASSVEIASLAVFMLVVAYRPQQMAWHAMSLSIILTVVYLYIPNRLIYAVAIAIGATFIFVALAATVGHLPLNDTLTMTLLLLLTNIFGSVAARRYQRLWRDEFRVQSVLLNLSVRDHLTGCYNRRHLHDKLLEREITRAQRYGLSLTVIMCDLDHFKEINDHHGHYAGDAVLCAFARLFQSMTREGIDSVVRYGGEEFLLILPATDIVGATLLAERLRHAFSVEMIEHAGGILLHTTASFGVATVDFSVTTGTVTGPGLIASADQLMYAAKRGGRNQVVSQQLGED